jgi:hypothetical protein
MWKKGTVVDDGEDAVEVRTSTSQNCVKAALAPRNSQYIHIALCSYQQRVADRGERGARNRWSMRHI